MLVLLVLVKTFMKRSRKRHVLNPFRVTVFVGRRHSIPLSPPPTPRLHCELRESLGFPPLLGSSPRAPMAASEVVLEVLPQAPPREPAAALLPRLAVPKV